jgi:mono/diheme cytochrome c family protein
MKHTFRNVLVAVALPIAAIAAQPAAAQIKNSASTVEQQQIQRGRYLVKVTGCNDCHTAGYAPAGGKVPESQWLTGDKLGWRGPWGTTYPINLRLYMANLTENNWVHVAKNLQARPPMPWFALHDMSEQDLRALHKYITYLGPAGEPAPVYVPPNREPKGPYIQFPASPQ